MHRPLPQLPSEFRGKALRALGALGALGALRALRALPALLLLAAVACTAGGCYRRVVGINGPASQNVNIEEANIKEGESFWEKDKPREVEQDRYAGGSLDRARTLPQKAPSKQPDSN